MQTAGSGGQVRLNEINFEYVYILLCSNGKTYVGHTSDLEKR